MKIQLWTVAAIFALPVTSAAEPKLPIFDAHIHYSHDAWESTPPKAAIAILRKAGPKRAMVSSSSDEGTQKLHAEAPDLIVPSLRPYRKRGELSSWVRDETIIPHLEARLKQYRYAAIGEFHVYGADADLPVVRRYSELDEDRLHADGERILKPRRLSDEKADDLVAFLESLSPSEALPTAAVPVALCGGRTSAVTCPRSGFPGTQSEPAPTFRGATRTVR